MPVITSDNWDPFEEGLLNVHGVLENRPYKGLGRKPLPILSPPPDLLYAQVCKKRRNGRLIEVVKRVVFGSKEEVLKRLGVDSEHRIHTAFIERLNLTIRNSMARFIRKTMNYSKKSENHSNAMDFFQAWYNFAKPHDSLRLEVNQGNKRWYQRTPAMAEGLTDHVWTLEEILNFRTPIQ
jgi:hypothetical protein